MIDSLYRPILSFFRTRRMRQFADTFHFTQKTTVLDVGGSQFNWSLLPTKPSLTIVNITVPTDVAKDCYYVVADACRLPFQEKTFDIVYSNSVIEHLAHWQNQQAMAKEVKRVGRQYYVQTPNKYFPIEPHYLAPFIHWLPKRFQPILVRYCTPRGWLDKCTLKACTSLVEEIRLVEESELKRLFPKALIWHERFAGLVKSLMAVQVDQK